MEDVAACSSTLLVCPLSIDKSSGAYHFVQPIGDHLFLLSILANMAISSSLLLVLYSICCLASAAAVPSDAFTFETERMEHDRRAVDLLHPKRSAQSGILASTLGKSLYWFGYFAVGESEPLKLLVDTGSTDLILNPGLYVTSYKDKH